MASQSYVLGVGMTQFLKPRRTRECEIILFRIVPCLYSSVSNKDPTAAHHVFPLQTQSSVMRQQSKL